MTFENKRLPNAGKEEGTSANYQPVALLNYDQKIATYVFCHKIKTIISHLYIQSKQDLFMGEYHFTLSVIKYTSLNIKKMQKMQCSLLTVKKDLPILNGLIC